MTLRMEPAGAIRSLISRTDSGPTIAARHMQDLGRKGASVIEGLAPTGPTRNYKSRVTSTTTRTGDNVRTTMGSRASHRHLVEDGRRPGRMPSPARMQRALNLDRRSAFLVARAIGRRGTKGHFVVKRARPRVWAYAQGTKARIARDVMVAIVKD